MNEGLVHLYWGDGKGKTTAAMGLALRALGQGKKVAVLQFLKDGRSGEIAMLEKLGAAVFAGNPGGAFVRQMSEEERADVLKRQDELLQKIMERDDELVVLDEACAAWRLEMVDKELLRRAVRERPAWREIVLTGREPADWMLEAADYSTEMRCEKHPFTNGIKARRGVEF